MYRADVPLYVPGQAAPHLADLSQSALSMYGAVAEAFSEPVARRFGVTCLHLLLIYKEAADLEVNHEDPDGTLIEVPDDKGQVTSKPFGQCSVEQMRRALQRKRKPASTKPLPPEAEALAEQYSEAVTSRFPKGCASRCRCATRRARRCWTSRASPWSRSASSSRRSRGSCPRSAPCSWWRSRP